MNQPPVIIKVMSNHMGMPHNSTLRKPLLYTARISTTARNIQIMASPVAANPCTHRSDLAVGHVVTGWSLGCWHGSSDRALAGIAADRGHWLGRRRRVLRDGQAWGRRQNVGLGCGRSDHQKACEEQRFHRIDSRPLGREHSIAHRCAVVQNGFT